MGNQLGQFKDGATKCSPTGPGVEIISLTFMCLALLFLTNTFQETPYPPSHKHIEFMLPILRIVN